jgi:hypothetical protein
MKTSELIGLTLDLAVAKCNGIELINGFYTRLLVDGRMSMGQSSMAAYNPSTDWAQGGPIIEREEIFLQTTFYAERWKAMQDEGPTAYGPTPLIAAMRCFVASKLGDEVEVPNELV